MAIKLTAIDIGRICIKIAGRESGKKCIIVDIIDDNFALITGPLNLTKVKRRRVNIDHIEPTNSKININRGATDDEIIEALTQSGMKEEMVHVVKPF
jgi:large subunit ribosomal protein L14e